jgi:hypothetical protein
MAELVRHRQTKEAETDMFDLKPPRHISTLPNQGPVELSAIPRTLLPPGLVLPQRRQ